MSVLDFETDDAKSLCVVLTLIYVTEQHPIKEFISQSPTKHSIKQLEETLKKAEREIDINVSKYLAGS